MIKAIYKRREDGDYDFVAAFASEQLPALPSDWPGEVIDWLTSEGELSLVVENVDLCKLPDVWVFAQPNTKFSDAANEPQPATTTPPALAETPCSAVSEGGRS